MVNKIVTKFALMLVLSLQSTYSNAQCCNYKLIMHDSYGDGWQGASIQVLINSLPVGNYSASNFQSMAYISLCNGDSLDLIYTAGIYENENSYELRDSSWNSVFYDGPTPDTGSVFSSLGNCDEPFELGNHPCTAIPVGIGCVSSGITDTTNSNLNPYPGEQYVTACYNGGDKWFSVIVPASGNLGFETFEIDSSSIGNTWLTIYAASTCTNRNVLYCIGSHHALYYASSYLNGLTAGETIYIQIWSCSGNLGSFQLCVTDYGTVALDSSNLPIVMINTLNQTIVPDTKINCLMDIKYNGLNTMTYTSDSANVYSGNIGIEIRGNTSASYPQHPYNIETRDSVGENNDVSILGMPAENDWVLISNYNDRSFLRNQIAYNLFREMGNYSVRNQLCEVLIDSVYQGVYLLGEKIRRNPNRVPIAKLTAADTTGDELTGGYILETTYWNANNSFQSNYSPIGHPTFDIHFVYEYPKPDIIQPQQRAYIASYVDSLETALYSSNFDDPNVGYRKYLDVPSFIDYFLVNELARNGDGFKKSRFYNKDKNSNGGKLKAGPVWDFDWSFKNQDWCWFGDRQATGWAHVVNDCDYIDNYSPGWYVRLLQDSTFQNELKCTYDEYRQNILDTATIFSYMDSITSILQNAQIRHFQKYPFFTPGPDWESQPTAATYNAELDSLKNWIGKRIQWLDANISGICNTANVTEISIDDKLKCYPNPANDYFNIDYYLPSTMNVSARLYNYLGSEVLATIPETKSTGQHSLRLETKNLSNGVYILKIERGKDVISKKIIILK